MLNEHPGNKRLNTNRAFIGTIQQINSTLLKTSIWKRDASMQANILFAGKTGFG